MAECCEMMQRAQEKTFLAPDGQVGTVRGADGVEGNGLSAWLY